MGAFGMEMMRKLINLRVFIHGLRGVGVETAKNLILSGPNAVTLHDDVIVSQRDLASNFCLTQDDICTRSRGQACAPKLQELNPHVKVSLFEGEITEELLSHFHVVFFTDSDKASLVRFNNFCRTREQPIGFLSCENWGAAGHAFVDYGDEFISFDKDGENNKSFLISNITNENPGIVSVRKYKSHTYKDGDYVVFKEVQGMSEINGLGPVEIKFISPLSFSIGDTRGFSAYTCEGIVEQVKVPTIFHFKSYEETLFNPSAVAPLAVSDLHKFGRPEQLHLANLAIRAFESENNCLPELLNTSHAERIVAIAQAINAAGKASRGFSVDSLDEDLVRKVSLYARAQVSPIATFWGGIMAQEIIKFTGKYTPIQQWLHIDFFEILAEGVDRRPRGGRYDDQIALIGRETHDKLAASKSFLVGAGALGCEFLKIYALMGVSSNGGQIVCTDDEAIKSSKLDREFLFRAADVSYSKSDTACKAARRINPEIDVIEKVTRLTQENEITFDDNFWSSIDFVTAAVNNVKSLLYLDNKCVWYEKPSLFSSTLGAKANAQVIIPHKTQNYTEPTKPLPYEGVAYSIMQNFPYATEHCIEWAKDEFSRPSMMSPKDVNKYLEDPLAYLASLGSAGSSTIQIKKLEVIKHFISVMKHPSFNDCIKIAREMMQDRFYNNIAQLLHNFPADFIKKTGKPFWKGKKRVPIPCIFDIDDKTHLDFIVSASNLFAYNLGLPENTDRDYIRNLLGSIQIIPFAPKTPLIPDPR